MVQYDIYPHAGQYIRDYQGIPELVCDVVDQDLQLVIAHADCCGGIGPEAEGLIEMARAFGTPFVVCSCYPQKVAQRYGVQTVGDWASVSGLYIKELPSGNFRLTWQRGEDCPELA
jgi:hypothetical protein